MKVLSIQDFLEQSSNKCIIDVRSEGEFIKGHVLHATNVALFDNTERAKVGTTYKQIGKDQAILEGLDIVGPKMANIVRTVNEINPTKEVYVYCWRGGMRSGSVGWLLETAGYTVYLLKGGYKSYRRFVNNFFETTPLQLKVIGGCTGSGKTELLEKLVAKGEQVLDLEQMAHHKGSAFGGLGQLEQPTKEDFDNTLFGALYKMDLSKPIWVEDESKNIGKIFLPVQLITQMQTSKLYVVHVPQADRITRLVNEYSIHNKEELVACLEKIKKRLGGMVFKDTLEALEANDFKTFAELILFYYDRSYLNQLSDKKQRIVKEIDIVNQNYDLAVEQLLQIS